MTMRFNISKVVALVLAAVMTFGLIAYTPVSVQADTKQQELEQKKKEAQQRLDEINQQIKENEETKENAEELKTQYEQQSTLIKTQIATLNEQIADLEEQIYVKSTEIDAKQAEVQQKQDEYDARWAGFKERMASMQMMNDGGAIALLSSATNIYQLLTFAETLTEISGKDTEICQELESERAELVEQKQALEDAKAELEASQTSLEEQNQQLDAKVSELASSIQAQDQTITEAEAESEALEAAEEEARKAVDTAAAELDSYLSSLISNYDGASIYCSLDFICPLPSYKRISCQFGANGHKGVDFAAPANTPIYAVADGVVMTATYHYSYGNYVFLNNGTDSDGNTYTTLYAHMISSPAVSAGQSVKKGAIIGYVGSTGNSTGNHLHFEMKVNGSRVNPLNYVPH